MNNEEKILTMLTQIQAKLEQRDAMFAEQGKQLAEQGKHLQEIDAHLQQMDKQLSKVATQQENIVLPSLRTIAASHSDLRKELASKESVAEIRSNVNLALTGIKTHSSQITTLTERVAKLEKAN